MKEDIDIPKVGDVAVAIVQEVGDDNTLVYNVYLINQRDEDLEKVLVTSKGYATVKKTGEKIKTSTLRKSLGDVETNSFQKIEPIMQDLFGLNNEYWVSFWIGNKMYDKKYIFLSETIKEEHFVSVPIINKKGVLIK
tara:strand:+ start:89537 stop:89947 length:411 start_codon:yes stop_codon:yes gene_type:complete